MIKNTAYAGVCEKAVLMYSSSPHRKVTWKQTRFFFFFFFGISLWACENRRNISRYPGKIICINAICLKKKIWLMFSITLFLQWGYQEGMWHCDPEANGSDLIRFTCRADAQAQTPTSIFYWSVHLFYVVLLCVCVLFFFSTEGEQLWSTAFWTCKRWACQSSEHDYRSCVSCVL